MEIIFSDLRNHWEGCRTRFGKWVRTGEAKWLRGHWVTEKASVVLPLNTECPAFCCHHGHFTRALLCTLGTTATTTLHVNGFTTPLLSPGTTFQFRVQNVHISLAEGQVVCLDPICKNVWLSDSVAFVASIVEDRHSV